MDSEIQDHCSRRFSVWENLLSALNMVPSCCTWQWGRKKALPVFLKRASRSREDGPWDPVISLWCHLLVSSPWGSSFKIESLRGLVCAGHSKFSWQDLRLSHVPMADSCRFGYVYPICLHFIFILSHSIFHRLFMPQLFLIVNLIGFGVTVEHISGCVSEGVCRELQLGREGPSWT